MYEHIVEIAKSDENIKGVRLYVDNTNVKAQNVYKSLGMNGDHYKVYEWMTVKLHYFVIKITYICNKNNLNMRLALINKIFIAITLIALLSGCKIKEIEVGEMQGMRIGEIKKDHVSLEFMIPIKNPNNFKFKISKVDLNIALNNSELGKVKKIKKIVVKANSDDTHELYVEIEYKKLLSGTVALIGGFLRKKADIKLNGYVKVKAFCILSKKIEIHENKPVKLFKDKK